MTWEHHRMGVTYQGHPHEKGPTKKLTVIVTGGRDYADRDRVFRELNALSGTVSDEFPMGTVELTIWHGACPTGADRWADEYAVVNWTGLREFKPDKARWGSPMAFHARNEQMAAARPAADICLAFPGGSGTADMVERARRHGIEVKEIT